MSLKDLESKYDSILGSAGGPISESSDSPSGESDTANSKVDSAYKQPAYDGGDSDGVDPRDPSTQKKAENKSNANEGKELDDAEEDGDELESDDSSDDKGQDMEPIPEGQVQAGRAAGLSDDEIIDLAENNPNVLKKLASVVAFKQSQFAGDSPVKDSLKGDQDEKGQGKAAAKTKVFEKLEIDVEEFDMDDDAKKAFGKMQGGFNKMAEIIDELNSRLENSEAQLTGVAGRQQIETRRRVDNFYDTASAEISVLGNGTKSALTADNIAARNEVQKVAYAYQKVNNSTDEEALQIGINALKGKLSKKELTDSLVQGLQRRKATSTFRPTGRREGEQPMSSKDKAMKKMAEILDRG